VKREEVRKGKVRGREEIGRAIWGMLLPSAEGDGHPCRRLTDEKWEM